MYRVIAGRSFQQLITKEAEGLLGLTHNSLRRVVSSLVKERWNEVSLQLEGQSGKEDPPSLNNNAVDEQISILNIRANKESLRDIAKGTKEAETKASIAQQTAQTTRFLHQNISTLIESSILPSEPILSNSLLSNSLLSDSLISNLPTPSTLVSQLRQKLKQYTNTKDPPLLMVEALQTVIQILMYNGGIQSNLITERLQGSKPQQADIQCRAPF